MTILRSVKVSSLTYFVCRFLLLIATILEKTNFAKYCLLSQVSGFLFLAHSLMSFASNLEDNKIFVFDDLMTARSPFNFRSLIEHRLFQLQEN